MVTSPYFKYLSGCLNALCAPDFGVCATLDCKKCPNSSLVISGTKRNESSFLSIGSGKVLYSFFADKANCPSTMQEATAGIALDIVSGSTVAQCSRGMKNVSSNAFVSVRNELVPKDDFRTISSIKSLFFCIARYPIFGARLMPW